MEQVKRPPGKGRGRGLLALTSYDPVPRPSKALAESHLRMPSKAVTSNQTQLNGHSQNEEVNGIVQVNGISQKNSISKDIRSNVSSIVHNGQNEGPKVVAKYNFNSNPDQPGGFKELTIKQGEHLTLLQKGHLPSKNPLWWEVRNNNGDVGYVPGNYCMAMENKPNNLPWLENKRLEEEKAAAEQEKQRQKEKENTINNNKFGVPENNVSKPIVKAYQPAYTENQASGNSGGTRKFYCDICDKQLNGPTPFSMHMASKAHREEAEYLNSCS